MNRSNSKKLNSVLDTRSLSEQVYEYLCTMIIEGKLNYGETLSIKTIAQELQVSSMPVREAIKRLELEGIITIHPRSRCVIKVPTKKSIQDALEMRELLETHCIESIYTKVAPSDLEHLYHILEQMKRIVAEGQGSEQVKQYIWWDREFHMELCRLTNNEYLLKFYKEISLHLNMNYIYNIAIPPDITMTLEHHTHIIEALSRHSPDAIELMKIHLDRSKRNVLEGPRFASFPESD
ncbi:MAG: GntR family transcriptional regulator [Spirochaetales bacterium]